MRISIKHKIKAHLAACALAGMAFSGSALSAIVYSGPVSINVPDSIDGTYVNLVTGASGVPAPAGYDINPYSAVAGNFNLWGATTQTWYNTAASQTNASGYLLPMGTPIPNAAANFFRPGGGTDIGTAVTLNSSNNYFGVRFTNESTSAFNVGWVQIQFGATPGTRTIVAYAYEDTGAAIAAGDTGTPGGGEAVFGFNLSSLDFGSIAVGSTSAPQSVTLTNSGDATGQIASFSITAPYAISGGSCGAAPELDPAETCTVAVTFSPTVTGPVEEALSFTEGGGNRGVITIVELNGNGIPGGPGPGPGAEPVVATVPVNSPWALAALLGLFGLIAGAMLRRR